MEELPPGQSPSQYASLEVGTTGDGAVQVWCKRHECNVVILSGTPRRGLMYDVS